MFRAVKRFAILAMLSMPAWCGAAEPMISASVSTSLGGFTIKLYHAESPRTVANFIRLAEGSVPWVDEKSGMVRQEPFYDGSEFHFVDSGRLSKAGLRNGGGPGYTFRDEVDNGLTFNKKYLVAMADRGPNTCGSEFFITAANTIAKDGENTIFGEIIKGFSVCDAINAVPTDGSGRPATPVVIHSVIINRGGVEFDENARGLPDVVGVSPEMSISPSGTTLAYRQNPRSLSHCCLSPDFQSWTKLKRYLDPDTPTQYNWNLNPYTAGQPRYFFATSIVEYGADGVMPRSLRNKTLTMVMISNDGGITSGATFAFNANGGGTYTFDLGGSGTITSHTWDADGYGGDLHMLLDGKDTLDARLGLDETTTLQIEGRNRGTYRVTVEGTPVKTDFHGTFTLSR
jgi:peptidyl-prolyl cis-trans isomerase A (cyclophilin A)